MLEDGYHDVPSGKLAAVVTSLEMLEKPASSGGEAPSPWSLRRVEEPDPRWYRELFMRVGSEYLWTSRLAMSHLALHDALTDGRVEVFALVCEGRDEGLLELNFGVPLECELTFLGVTPPLVGTGAGSWLLRQAIERAWSRPLSRCWVHTCTLDHPRALALYERAGFRPFRRQVEVFDDPRVTGVLATNAAAGVPVL